MPLHYSSNLRPDLHSSLCVGIMASAVSLLLTSGAFKRVVAWNEARKTRKAVAAAQIYRPIYILIFVYGIIASAVSLLLTSGAFKRVVAWNEARKARKAAAAAAGAAANNEDENDDEQQGTKKKYCCCKKKEKKKKKKKKKKKPPPTLGVVDYYSGSALNVAVIASFGFFYPSVAILGVIHMALNAYVTRMKVNDMLSCQKGPKRADLLRIEGASGLPASAVVAVVGINAGLFFFVFGPFGMITPGTSIQMAAYVAPVLALVGVVFSKFLAHQWQTRAARQLEKLTPALNIPLMDRMSEGMSSMRSSLNLDGGETKGATGVARNDGNKSGSTSIRDMLERYAESFDEWSKMQEEELEEDEEEEELTRERYSTINSFDAGSSKGSDSGDEMSRRDTVMSSESFSLNDDVDRDASGGETSMVRYMNP